MFENKEKKRARVGFVFLLLGLSMIVIPFAINADLMDWGFACAFVGLFISIVALIFFLTYRRNSIFVEENFTEENLLANWRYPRELEDINVGKIASIFFGCIILLIGFIFLLVDVEDNLPFFIGSLLIAFFIMIFGTVIAGRMKENQDFSDREILIYKKGMVFEGEVYTWLAPLMTLKYVGVQEKETKNLVFIFTRVAAKRLYKRGMAIIPIPMGMEQTAKMVADYYNMPIPPEFNVEEDRIDDDDTVDEEFDDNETPDETE